MNKIIAIASEVEKTLQSLDNYPKVKADDFFYTRLSVKLENTNEPLLLKWFFEIPYLKPALIVVFLAINIVTISTWLNLKNQKDSLTNITNTFIEEYDLNTIEDSFLVLNE